MNKIEKQQTVQQLTQDLENRHFYLVNSQGLNAEEQTQIRYKCFKNNVKYRIVKNTLLLKALEKIKDPQLNLETLAQKALKGSTALFITQEDPSQPAKIIQEFHKNNKLTKPQLKAAFIYEELYIGTQNLKPLTQLKSQKELLAEVLQLLQGPTQNLLSALQTPQKNLANALTTLTKQT